MSSTRIKGHSITRKHRVRFDGNRAVATAQEVPAPQPPEHEEAILPPPSRRTVLEEPTPTTFSFSGPRPDDAKYLDWENRLIPREYAGFKYPKASCSKSAKQGSQVHECFCGLNNVDCYDLYPDCCDQRKCDCCDKNHGYCDHKANCDEKMY
uniref:Uncharacterized protein n=1 Tax=Romanomermis culicivorax TaxID=13658 RepID=A0A915L1J6_ROMCU